MSPEAEATRQRILIDARDQSAKLFDWQSPAEFRAILDALDTLIAERNRLSGTTANHRERAIRHWREGWVLQHIFENLGVRMARLEKGRDLPDAEVELADRSTIAVEVTEAISRSHDPSLRPKPGVYAGDYDHWRENAAEIPGLLESAGRRKAPKLYASRSRLLVYLHASGTWGRADQQINAAIVAFQVATPIPLPASMSLEERRSTDSTFNGRSVALK